MPSRSTDTWTFQPRERKIRPGLNFAPIDLCNDEAERDKLRAQEDEVVKLTDAGRGLFNSAYMRF